MVGRPKAGLRTVPPKLSDDWLKRRRHSDPMYLERRRRFIQNVITADPDADYHAQNFEYWANHFLEDVMLLFPDMQREQHRAQEFVFAAPCQKHEWHTLEKQAEHIINDEGNKGSYLPFVRKKEEDEPIIIILRGVANTDDECLATAAYLRMVEEFTGMIYALPYTQSEAMNSIADIIRRTAGVPPHQVRHIEVK